MANITKDGNITTITKDKDKPFRILQLTDIHLGGSLVTRKHDTLALNAIRKVIENANADFIAVTGDMCYPFIIFSGTHNNIRAIKKVSELIESFNIPWAPVFGNHDTESFAKANKDQISDYFKSLPNCLFEPGPKEITGVGNYSVLLKNPDGTINKALMFIDSNAYLTNNFFSGFDIIHDDQVEWYKTTIKDLSKDGPIIESLAFYHIPPKEVHTAWTKWYMGNKENDVKYFCGFFNEKDNYSGYPKETPCNFFSEMVKLGSCKGMFFGHDHLNTASLEYQGIRLTYGMSIDYHAYVKIAKKHTQRGGTLIDIYDDGSFDVNLLPLDTLE